MDNKALYTLSYGLYVLTAKEGDFDNGCITNTAMQITSDPLTIVVSVNKQNKTHDMIMNTKEFNVSVLTEKASFDLFKQFGFQSGHKVNKFEGIEYAKRADNGILYITQATNAVLSGKVINTVDFSTHTMFIAEVTDAQTLSTEPSTTYAYYQSNIKPKPEATKAKGWRCNICGYVYEGDPLPADYICPICKHGAVDFVKIEN